MKDESTPGRPLMLTSVCLGFAVVQLDVTIVNTALESIRSSLGGGVTELQWIVNAYTISFAALILTAGALGDRLGAKRVLMAGFAVFTAASLAAALAPATGLFIAARSVQGLGAALLVPNSLALLRHAYPDDRGRARAIGIWAAAASLALSAGPVAGGALVALLGWRSIFLVNVPLGLAGLWLAWRHARETPRSSGRRLDLPGQLAAMGALGCLAFAMIEAGVAGWRSAPVTIGFAASAVSAGLFVCQERREAQPMLPLSLFRQPRFASVILAGVLANAAFYGLIFVFSLYFRTVQGWSPFVTGLAFLPMIGAILPANLLAAPTAERIGGPATIVAGLAASALGCIALVGIGPNSGYASLWAPLAALGAGLGLLVPPLTSTLLGCIDKARGGLAAGALNAARQVGSVIGVALFGSLVASGRQFVAGLHEAMLIAAALLLAAIAAIAAGSRGGHVAEPTPAEPVVARAD